MKLMRSRQPTCKNSNDRSYADFDKLLNVHFDVDMYKMRWIQQQ
jgi:hypothetical protein